MASVSGLPPSPLLSPLGGHSSLLTHWHSLYWGRKLSSTCPNLSLSQSITVPIYHCPNISLSQSITVPIYHCSNVLMNKYSNVPLYQCGNVPMSQKFQMLVGNGFAPPLSTPWTAPWNCLHFATSECFTVSMLKFPSVSMSQCNVKVYQYVLMS